MTETTDNKKQATVFVSGMFNVLHPGHFRFLKYASGLGNKLIVGVLSDRIVPEVTIPQKERLQNLRSLDFIDEAFILDDDPEKFIEKTKPDIVVKGWEHHNEENPEKKILESYGGKLFFSSGDINKTGFKSQDRTPHSIIKTIARPKGFIQRHNFTVLSTLELLEKFESLNVCVLGDIIIDDYVDCQPVGMSREDPTIVVRPSETKRYLGGAGIVSAHAHSLGAQVHFISVCGDDEAGIFSAKKLKEYGVNAQVFTDESRPTTQKKRYRASGKSMLRVNNYSDHPISETISNKILEHINNIIYDLDVIIFSDFSYGVLPQRMVDTIIDIANKHGIITAADSQTSSQTGNITRFKEVSLVTPTEHEARTATKNYADGLVKLSDNIRNMTKAHNVIITLSEDGLFISGTDCDKNNVCEITNDRLPALVETAIDPAGAGDALLVTSAMCLASGGSIWEAMFLGSIASAVQVSRVGNTPLELEIIHEALTE